MPPSDDWRESRFSPRPRPSDSFANRSVGSDVAARRQARLATRNNWADSDFRGRLQTNRSFVNRSPGSDAVDRRQTRQPFNNYWANSNFRERLHTNNSFVNRSRSTAFWNGTRESFKNNWKGAAFGERQYWAFRNYQSQWHDSGWWRHNCDRIVFVTVYSQPFPFYFDAGYWYPCWGYYPDAYYPYDGPIYGYNDLPPDQVIANVQTELYNEGYYNGPIDGILGPDTRAAIADYQADHGLAVTAAIDERTVVSLGLA
jgi:Putative peptidoglycan binding domain